MKPPFVLWNLLTLLLLVIFMLDLFILRASKADQDLPESPLQSAFWIVIALLYNLSIYFMWGILPAMIFLAALIFSLRLRYCRG